MALIQTTFMIVALASIAFTLWVSWQLEGGAGAINEAGRMRMATYRMVLDRSTSADPQQLAVTVAQFDAMVQRLREGDVERPLFVPSNEACQTQLAAVAARWPRLREALLNSDEPLPSLRAEADAMVETVDRLVSAIEHTIASRTAMLGGLCFGLVVLVAAASVAFVSGTFVWIVRPLQRLRDGLATMARRDFSQRIDERNSVEEFASLARGFNRMADTLQRSYRGLEDRVAEKTADLARQNERLAALYEVALLGSSQTRLETLAQTFARKIREVAGADAAAVRLVDQAGKRLLLLAQTSLPEALLEAERCVQVGSCACGDQPPGELPGTRVIPIRSIGPQSLRHCEAAGYQTVVVIPMRTAQHGIGEVELFFYGERTMSPNERQLLDAMVGHVATQLENLRLAARDRELAVSQERNLLAQELHDSIAQSLAFLKIQVALLRDALHKNEPAKVDRSLAEIDAGVRESYADVRELLLHFRTRSGHEDIEHALRSTLAKFERQSGIATSMTISGDAVPLPPDQQVQVLHVVQEALSNARKHSGAAEVALHVHQAPHWCFEVRDDGRGFDVGHGPGGEEGSHVGLRIMRERAQRIGALLRIDSAPGRGTRIRLELPPDGGDAVETDESQQEQAA
ncbi:HAMP domain-containing protein [Roseateles sp. DAIF2]|uniref:type IV pili methyl-accepting chemotaxis transducer N-terminal domain-containing protein n=1 Tax=Roseateles sp. DAIF2 TaxID=2714952 RepID=UPI0018A3067D|nr:type IV pili methyl-accepting chemotaxis transducer N-terminal domain-containing protein [Roseateles sp. DAIF2]QPF74029.1 HAMP domain-containing protein [Roseateles sp. DAIF2]